MLKYSKTSLQSRSWSKPVANPEGPKHVKSQNNTVRASQRRNPSMSFRKSNDICSITSAFLQYMCFAYPATCSCCIIASAVFGLFFTVGYILNPTQVFGVIKNDYSNIASEYDLSLGKIDHWCLKGDNDSCSCEDPLEPSSRAEFRSWVKGHNENKKHVEDFIGSNSLDVVFLGESIVEEMDGRWMGRSSGEELEVMRSIFDRNFNRENSGMQGVALGVAGDAAPNVLWRLQHGEMPDGFNPRVWWIIIGMNDLGRMQCSEDVVVLGILRVAEEIRARRPKAKIVINSLLPMMDLRGGLFPGAKDYRDAFRNKKGQLTKEGEGPKLDSIIAGNPKLQMGRGTMSMEMGMGMGQANNLGGMGPAGQPKGAQMGGNKAQGVIRRGLGSREGKPFPHRSRRRLSSDLGMTAPMGMGMTVPMGMGFRGANGGSVPGNKRDKDAIEAQEYLKMVKKDPINPKVDLGKNKVKARDPKSLFLKKNQLPLWTSVDAINKEVRKYCDNREMVTFFDATDIFAEHVEGSLNQYVLRSDRISVRGHPTEEGFALWEDAMAEQLKTMVEIRYDEPAKSEEQTEEVLLEKEP